MSNVRALPQGDAIAAQILAAFTNPAAPGHIPPPRPYWADQSQPRPEFAAIEDSQPRPVHDEQLLAEHHVTSLAFARKALGASPTLTDTLLLVCDSWPDRAEAERWRRAIAIEDYMSARDELARTHAVSA